MAEPGIAHYSACGEGGGTDISSGTISTIIAATALVGLGIVALPEELNTTGEAPENRYEQYHYQPGSMLIEGLVGVMALIAASAMHPGDYFAINTSPAVFATLGQSVVNLPEL